MFACIYFFALVTLLEATVVAQVRLGSEQLAANDFKELQGKRVGLITKVVPKAQVLDEAYLIAGIINENGPLAVQAIKKSVLAGLGLPMDKARDPAT